MTSSRIPTLDGLRGIAILMVLAGHTAQNYQPLGDGLRRWLFAFANSSGGVRLFFVLSGYLITYLLLQEHARNATISIRGFYRRRIFRIFPAFYAFLLGALVWNGWRGADLSPGPWIAAGTFSWNYAFLWTSATPAVYWDLGHLWTLALEQQFYLVWPLLLVWAGPRRGGWVALALIAWCPLARVATYLLFPGQRGFIGMMFHTAVDSLMVGCAAALFLQSATARARLVAWGPAASWAAALWFFAGSPVLGTVLRGFPVTAGLTLDALAAAVLIVRAHHCPGPLAATVLGRGLLPALGLVSYSLYLWQQLFLSETGGLVHGYIVAPWAAALGAAVLSYCFVEKPILRFKSRPDHPRAAVPVPLS